MATASASPDAAMEDSASSFIATRDKLGEFLIQATLIESYHSFVRHAKLYPFAARESLQADGIPTAVVSMPCWNLFEAQDEPYRRQVLGEGTVRIALEAAVRLGWGDYIGQDGGFFGVKSFGASAPPEELFRHFGITPTNVVAEAKARLSGR